MYVQLQHLFATNLFKTPNFDYAERESEGGGEGKMGRMMEWLGRISISIIIIIKYFIHLHFFGLPQLDGHLW